MEKSTPPPFPSTPSASHSFGEYLNSGFEEEQKLSKANRRLMRLPSFEPLIEEKDDHTQIHNMEKCTNSILSSLHGIVVLFEGFIFEKKKTKLLLY